MIITYLKRYPLSLLLIATVLYLSFFKPPTLDEPLLPGMDKLVHICMYGAISGMLWIEFLLSHRGQQSYYRAFWGAIVCPVFLGGLIELLQSCCTTYRGGEWLDLAANTSGVVLATLVAWFLIRPRIQKRENRLSDHKSN